MDATVAPLVADSRLTNWTGVVTNTITAGKTFQTLKAQNALVCGIHTLLRTTGAAARSLEFTATTNRPLAIVERVTATDKLPSASQKPSTTLPTTS